MPEELDEKLNIKLKELKPKKYKKWISASVASILIIGVSYSIIPSFKTFGDTVFKYIFGDIGVENAVNFGYMSSKGQKIKIGDYDISIENMYIDDLRISFDAIIENDVDNMSARSSLYVEGLGSDDITKKVKIGDYDISIENMYIDDLRISFDAIIENDVEDMSARSSLYVEGLGSDDITINNGVFYKEDKKLKANVLIIGDGVAEIIKNKNELDVQLKLVKHRDIKDEILGVSKMTIKIPKEIQTSEYIEINKTIKEKNMTFNIEKLQASPTMMYLYTSGKVEGIGSIQGMYNFKIISDSGELYKENITLAGLGDKNGYKQTIVPSVYYDKSKKLRLKAEGVLIDANKKVKVALNGSYPKVIDYYGIPITIKNVKYENNRLIVEILNNDNMDYMGVSYIDGESTIEGYFESGKIHGLVFDIDKRDSYDLDLGINNDNMDYMGVSYIDGESTIEGYFESGKIHGLVFDIDKRDSYDLDLGIILKHKIPIDIEIENKFSK